MKRAKSFEILRGVHPTGLARCNVQPQAKPVRVAVLLNEEEFRRSGYELDHLATVFLDDRFHDWDWLDGKFYYFGHGVAPGELCDVLIIYEITDFILSEVEALRSDVRAAKKTS